MRRKAKTPLFEKIARDLSNLRDEGSRARYLARRRGFQRTMVVRQLVEASRTNLRIDTRQALSLAEAAVTIARRLRNKDTLGGSLRSKANALFILGDNQGALEYHAQALEIFRATRNAEQQARTLNASIQPLILISDYDQAFAAAAEARKIFRRLGDQRHLAHLEINTGNIYHRQDRFEEGLSRYERAYEMLLPLRDSEGLAVALYNVSVCLIALNDFDRALATYQRARQMCLSHGMTLLVGQADYNIAYLYYLRGEYSRAIDGLRAARKLCEKNGDAHILALCHLDLSDIYLELNLAAEAIDAAREGFVRFEKLGMRYEKAKCLANQALALSRAGKSPDALELFAQARAAFVREKNHVWPRLIDLYRALVLLDERRLAEARKSCERALQFFRSSTLAGKCALCCLVLTRIELEAGNTAEAREHCEEALRRLAALDLPMLNYHANFLMGRVHRAGGDPGAAQSAYQKAREALEALRSGLGKDELKIAFMDKKLEVYESLVELCLNGEAGALCPREKAFEYVESAKSRSLMERMLPGTETRRGGQQSALTRRISTLRRELNWYYHRIEQEQLRQQNGISSRFENLQREASAREKDLVRALREVPDSEPAAAVLRGSAGIALREVQSVLAGDTLIVEYFAVRDHLHAALITRQHLKFLPVALVSRVTNLVRMLRFQLSKLSLGPQYTERFEPTLLGAAQRHLAELHTELLKPLGSHLQYRHLVFIPHGVLYALPFHALFDGERYLIDRFSVSYAPSASIYRLCHDRPIPPRDSSLVLGVPDAKAPLIGEEISAVASQLRSAELFSGPAATERVLREKGAQARVIHIATHGQFRQDNPMFSRIRLGGSYLSVFDLSNLHLPADLVTLSGCGTGLNAVAAGDEPVGLMRGLLGAGARSLLLTLWDVHDQSTTKFMKAFYRCLQTGETKAQAFRLAVEQTRDQYAHPYHWAPFFLVGSALAG